MLAESISDQVQPVIDRLARFAQTQSRFLVRNAGVVDDGEIIGVVGIRCEESDDTKKPALYFSVVVTHMEGSGVAQAKASVGWSVPWILDRHDGFVAYEAWHGPESLGSGRLSGDFVAAFDRLAGRFEQALRRGKPPGRLLSWWRRVSEGLPLPQVIRISQGGEKQAHQGARSNPG